ncbi:EmrB/QacA subfamily drug resistance transporter [Chitinophaga dinghuensis]|uniref:EmrB/QacA subfamily drug resistance transporter n=1 Tax=Chitinophaga dinghuensis TaxID=1539050 RepID=A0A327W1S2_9BACT|nr:MFS transporter [Chitinophaga dinghuensis]RAJ82226.1 EmrB/QacA subfamily drug resistance transporter [Chitinophaga dinghuensis]
MGRISSKWWALLIVSTAVFLAVIDIFIVNVALPSIQTGLHSTEADIQLVIAAYLLGYAAFLITAGRMGDYFGKKRVFITGILAFTLTSCLCGMAQTATQLNIARFLQGISAALMIPQSIAYIHVLFPVHEERIKALGIYGSIAGTASVIGQFLGGIIPEVHWLMDGWRWIFLINLPIGILAAILATRRLTDTNRQQESHFDTSGVLLLTATLSCLVYPLIHGRELGWPLWAIAMLLTAFLLLGVFIRHQYKKGKNAQQPLINLQLFRFRDFNIALGAVLFYFMVQDSYFLINTVMLQNGLGYSSGLTGLLFVYQGVGYVLASLLAIKLMKRFGKKVLQVGVLIMTAALIGHTWLFNADLQPGISLYLLLFVYGMGCGSVLPGLLTLSLKSIPASYAGAASGTYTTFQQTAVALGIGITGGIFFWALHDQHTTIAYLSAYHTATWLNVAFLLIVSVLLYCLPED